jgi:translation initiation factor 2A
MPAKAVLFDAKANPAHDLGLSPRNYINFQPQGRFFLLAGFGNLSGTIDVWDRKSMKKVAQISAPNASACEWSPCGSFIMSTSLLACESPIAERSANFTSAAAATLSPRLRVDNGFKVWYVGGQLLASEAINDLYQALWRPMPSAPDFPAAIPPCPAFSASVSSLPPPPPKPVAAGAYRPPGARAAGTSTPSVFLREDQGGAPSSGPPGAPAYAANGGKANGRRNVPGYVPKEDGTQTPKKGKKGKKDGRQQGGDSQPQTPTTELAPPLAQFPAVSVAAPAAEVADVDPVAKKVRNLSKKVGCSQLGSVLTGRLDCQLKTADHSELNLPPLR